jgi:GNAT superfamily N-acetyltransferase
MGLQISTDPSLLAEAFPWAKVTDIVLVALYQEVPAGFLTANVKDRSLRIACHFVEEGFRGIGIGAELLESAVEIAISKGLTEVAAEVFAGDRVAKIVYEGMGFKAKSIVVVRNLSL